MQNNTISVRELFQLWILMFAKQKLDISYHISFLLPWHVKFQAFFFPTESQHTENTNKNMGKLLREKKKLLLNKGIIIRDKVLKSLSASPS